jgi:hypothetical protein
MTRRGVLIGAATALCLFPSFISGSWIGQTSASWTYIYVQTFDGAWPPDFYILDPEMGSWQVGDNNAASGLDYWGRTSYRSYAGTYSAWCGQNGVNSVNMQPNSLNHFYDQDMQSCMAVYLGRIGGYEAVSVAFAYWAETGTTTPNDCLEVRAFDGSDWTRLWMQPNIGNRTWEIVALSVPLSSTWLGWFFFSDAEVGLGPYEGVYVDNIIIAGNDNVWPESSAGPHDPYWPGEIVYVPYNATDSFGSGVHHVELYYRHNGTGGFVKYTPSENPSGNWTSGFVAFNTSLTGGDGAYEFYTVATDIADNVEPAPSSADFFTVVDTERPTTDVVITESPGTGGWYMSAVNLLLWASDAGSGVNSTWFSIDSGPWEPYSSDAVPLGSDGEHQVRYYSVDRAGNQEQIRIVDVSIDREGPELDVSAPLNGTELASDEVTVSWSCSDALSGIDFVVVTIDGEFCEYCNASANELMVGGLSGGDHEVLVTAYDHAGNSAEVSVSFSAPEEGAKKGSNDLWKMAIAGLIVLVVVALVLLLTFIMRGRSGHDDKDTEDSEFEK